MPSQSARPPSTFRRSALTMAAFGIGVGLVFPPFAHWVLETDAAYEPVFWVLCVAAGLVVGAANFAIAFGVVGKHVQRLADAMYKVNERVAHADATSAECGEACRLPITSSDSFGRVEQAFNDIFAGRLRPRASAGKTSTSRSTRPSALRVGPPPERPRRRTW